LKSLQAQETSLICPDHTMKNHASDAKVICLHAAERLLWGTVCFVCTVQSS